MISSILSQEPMFSLQQSFVWIRFPIYAVAIQTWIGKRKDFREIMLIFIFIGMMLMNLILITELIVEPKSINMALWRSRSWCISCKVLSAYYVFFSSYLLSKFSLTCLKSWFILFSYLLQLLLRLLTEKE